MAYTPKPKIEITPKVRIADERTSLGDTYLYRHGDTTDGYYVFSGVISASTVSGNTLYFNEGNFTGLTGTNITTNYITGATGVICQFTACTANIGSLTAVTGYLSSLSATSMSASTYYSGSTPLWNIILGTRTTIQNGLNTYITSASTAGGGIMYQINSSGMTLDNLTVSGNTSLNVLSASTIYSGSTPLSSIFVTNGNSNGGGNNIFTSKIGSVLQFNTLSAGTNITILSASTGLLTISAATQTGTTFSGQNLSTGTQIYAGNSGTNLQFNTLSGNGISISSSGGLITLSANTNYITSGTNVGGGVSLYTGQTNNIMAFRTLSGSSAITVTQSGNIVNIQSSINGSNLGSGTGVFSSRNNNLLQFKSLSGTGGVTLTNDANTVVINTPTIPSGAYLWTAGNSGSNSLKANNGTLTVAGNYAIGAGKSNNISGKYTGVLNGYKNVIDKGAYNIIGGGKLNKTTDCNFTFNGNGNTNYINTAHYSSIVAGKTNQIIRNTYGLIGNGISNVITQDGTGKHSTILNGSGNGVAGSYNQILNGYKSSITISDGANKFNSIINGSSNVINRCTNSTIVGGTSNYLNAVNNSAIIGGSSLTFSFSNSVLVPYLHINNVPSGGAYMLTWNSSNKRVYQQAIPSSTGEANTASNMLGIGLFSSKVGVDLQLRGLSAGTGIAITQQTSAVTITYTGTTPINSTNINGINTFTAGTTTAQSINITGASLANLTVSGNTTLTTLSAGTLSASTIISGSTNLYGIFQPIGSYITSLPSMNFLPLSGGTVTGNTIFTLGLSAGTFSASTINSGSTNLYQIFQPLGTYATPSQLSTNINGLNTYTAGTATAQSVNVTAATLNNLTVSANTTLSTVTANTVSATTFYSGATELSRTYPFDASSYRIKGINNRWHINGRMASYTPTALSTNRLYLTPLPSPVQMTMTGIGISLTASATTSFGRLGIYDADSNNLPNNLIYDAGLIPFSGTPAAIQITGFNLVLTGSNLYYLAMVTNSGGGTIHFNSTNFAYTDILGKVGAATLGATYLFSAVTTTNLPSTLGGVNTGLSFGTANYPAIEFSLK